MTNFLKVKTVNNKKYLLIVQDVNVYQYKSQRGSIYSGFIKNVSIKQRIIRDNNYEDIKCVQCIIISTQFILGKQTPLSYSLVLSVFNYI